jgi:NADPH:quinone reductase-like Zn-dependent oxidoreductase/signal transduction histidine kinase
MASLRARVLASVLVLAALGLVALAAVTYAEQRSFLLGRVDRELRSAGPALSRALDDAGFRPTEAGTPEGAPAAGSPGAEPGRGQGTRPGPPNLNLPPGTYGQRRNADGKVLGHVLITYGETAPAAPRIPAQVPIGKLFTVGSVGSSGLRYRAYASRDPEDSGVTVAAVPLHDVDQTLNRLLLVEGLVIAGVLLALGLSAFFVVRLGLRPLDRMEVTAGEIAAGQLSRRVSPADSHTEVGRLGLALNAMLERLEQAFAEREAGEERLRRFLADASHELRTPLASIRGYAELFGMGATRDEADARTAMRRIEDESKRMGVLVEDLLTLARLDEAPELSRAPVDLALLARDAVEDARATAPERPIDVHAPASAIVTGDAHRLRQVLANLLRNALVHTPAGTPIEVSVEEDAQTVSVTVRDHGPGLPGTSPGRMFERFWRAEGGRERGRAGAGLGLSIVGNVVDAHRGEVSARNADGGGAEFVVVLPKPALSPPGRAGAGSTARSRSFGHNAARMRAMQIVEETGPDSALRLVDLPEPEASHPMTPGEGVLVDVYAAGVSFPEVLQTRGMYQVKPPLPFVPGSEVAGIVRSAPDGASVGAGDRVAALCGLGGFAEVAVAPAYMTFALPDALDFAQGAGLILNYHTAYFCLLTRGRLKQGETVLVHGAAGGVGTAVLQVAKALGAKTIAVVSSEEKARVAEQAGADQVVLLGETWKDEVKERSGGGVDLVIDPVGGERFTDSLRSLRQNGRLVVVGFTGGSIPEVKVNRLLLGNTEVIGAGWGAYVMGRPEINREIGAAIATMIDEGFVRPIVGERYPLERAAEALHAIDERRATGKVVLDVRER